MANYSLVINSQFKPFSYQEMLAPVLTATQAHQELENQYGELATKASVWEEMANEQTDPYAYKMYKTYANDLEEQAGQLAREGLNASSRRDMFNMRARYSKEITPIEAAYKRREELAAEQRKASLSNPTMFYQRNASAMSLDDFIKNPSIDYGERYSGALLAQQVGQMAANLKTALTGKGKLKSIGLPYQYEQLLQYGYTPQQIQQAITNPQEGNPVLNTIVEQALAASGMKNWASPTQLAQARAYATQGLYNSIGKTEFKNYTDNFSMNDELARRKETRAAQERQTQSKGFALNPSNIYSSRKLNEEEQRYKNNVQKFSKYFYTDPQGRMRLTWAGAQEYRRNATPETRARVSGSGSGTAALMNAESKMSTENSRNKFTPTEFRRFVDSLGGGRYIDADNWQPGNVGNLWTNYVSNNPASRTVKYDATRLTEYIYDVDQSLEYQRQYKAKLSRAIDSSEEFKEVDYDPETNTWKETGKALSFADFDTDDYALVSRAPSELGSTLFIRKKGEKARRYLAPSGINTTAEGGRDQVISERLMTQRKLQDSNLTAAQRSKLENYYDQLTQQQAMFESQLDVVNKTKDQEFSPYYIP